MDKGNQGRTEQPKNVEQNTTDIDKAARDISEIDRQEGNLHHGRKGGNFDEHENTDSNERNEPQKSE